MPDDTLIFAHTPELVYVTPQATNIRRIQRPLHQHEHIAEMLFVYRGDGTYTCDGYVYDIHAGDFLLTNQNDIHEIQSAHELEIGTVCFGMAGLQLIGRKEGRLARPEEGYVRPAGDHFHTADSLCHTIYHLMEYQQPYERITAQHLFLGLLLLALRCPADERSKNLDHNAVLATRIHQYITLHYTEPLTLQSIADALNISPYYTSHVFKNRYEMSPIQFMINCRIGEAQNLLIATDYSATQIGLMVGYDSINHFNSIFKQKVGMPPIQYRKYYLEQMHGKRTQ